ncbi:putative aluminum-activated malate transporter [Helianthus annuus]|nr:putative aluminum-activated malate transporter [Helianthus annuus]
MLSKSCFPFTGTVTSFMKLWPTLVPYEYGFRVILFTYCMIMVSGYRLGNPIKNQLIGFTPS